MSADSPAGGAPAAPWLVCRSVNKRYGGLQALAGADLDLVAGEVHGLIGPNGAGKSTLVKILTGAVARDGGSVTVDGVEAAFRDPAEAVRHGLVLMPQEISVVPAASVVDNINLGTEPTRWGLRSAAACRREAAAALALLDLDIDPQSPAGSLSTAHQRLLMMARAVHRKARLLILDEPTAGMPPHEADLVVQVVRRLAHQALTIVFVSHHLSQVASLCDRVTCVREGRVVGTLGAGELSKERLVEVLTGVPAGTAAPVAGEPAVAVDGGDVRRLELRHVSGTRLRDVSLVANRGWVTGITGLLGSGMTEVVDILAGAARPLSGEVCLDGRPVTLTSPVAAVAHGIGYLAGDRTRASFATMSIRSNVSVTALHRWFGRLGLLRPAHERRRVDESLATLSVTGDTTRPIATLSGGNQQRALVARLLAAESSIIILDEPTVGVDVRARATLWAAVRELAVERTVIVCSSEPEELVALCDQVVCIADGRVSAVLAAEEISETSLAGAVS